VINNNRVSLGLFVATLVSLIGSSASAPAQDSTKSSTEKWRPKDGIYVVAGKDFAERCDETTEFVVELREKSVGGNEWNCKVERISDTASDALRLSLTCNDYNLAEDLDNHDPNPYDRKFKEVMTLRKVDEKSFLIRKTLNGKFRTPEWHAVFCPQKAQQAYLEAKARDREEVQRKAATKNSGPAPAKWQ
jgi:hypothetical protein